MPKKSAKDGSDTRKRRGSTKDSRVAANSTEDPFRPPTPKAKHLFASNPFDDPSPASLVSSGPNYIQGSPRLINPQMHMPGMPPNFMPKGPFSPAGWKPNPAMHGPAWQQGPGEPMPPMGQGYPCSPMDFNRLPMPSSHGPMKHSPYGAPMPGQDRPREGPPFDHMHQDPSHMPVPPSMVHPSAGGYPKLNTRKQDKARKSESGGWGTKTKKTKLEPNPVAKSAELRIDDWPMDTEKQSPVTVKSAAPHAALPTLPQNCVECSKELEEPLDNTICCLASCKGWYHRNCTGLTKAALECLRGEELALWACDRCLGTKEITSVRLRKTNQSSESPVPPTVSVKS